MVYVISQNGKSLMPCENVVARLLLKQGKAKVKKRTPFTIKLLYEATEYTQELTLGIDTGSSHIGSAVSDNDGDIYYMSDVEIRNDITDKMTQRAKYRRNRRNRKTRYRKARWMNRKNSIKTDRFSPTMRSKFHSHEKEIEFVKSILPIKNLVLETSTFDPHLMKNPDLHNPIYRHWAINRVQITDLKILKQKFLIVITTLVSIARAKRKILSWKSITLFIAVVTVLMKKTISLPCVIDVILIYIMAKSN